ncbi:MAG: class I SAM-dependent methyltransferase [Acidobacteriota bacterium]|nr:class I SAM-dependent methyltransferase [Acidobacteriota bacterium]
MNELSELAIEAALIRAYHTQFDTDPLIQDKLADSLVSRTERVRLLSRLEETLDDNSRREMGKIDDPMKRLYRTLRAGVVYGTVIVRGRYLEDHLKPVEEPFQFVNLAAGLDTWPYRQQHGGNVTIYEVDHDEMLESKRGRLARAGFRVPWNVVSLAADMERDSLTSVLSGGEFLPERPTLFACLGLAPYLTRVRLLGLMCEAAELSAPKSELIFDYYSESDFKADEPAMHQLVIESKAGGAAPRGGFKPEELHGILADSGFALAEDLDGNELTARYCQQREDGLTVAAPFRVLRAVKAA